MINQKTEILEKLEKLAYEKSKPFCLGCYKEAPTNRCQSCGSDDLARLLPGCGIDWSVDFIIEEIVREHCTPIDMNKAFEDSMRECYDETTTVGWMKLDTVTVMMEQDPICWRIAQGEWEDSQVEDEQIITFDGSTYYSISDVEGMLG